MSGGRYEMIRPIASGGMATVYLGRALQPDGTKKPVAIKMMHEQLAEQRHFVDMFLDEARLAMRIHHPNVVETLDVVGSEGTPFLVMDLVEGPTLYDLLQGGSRVSAPIALRILIDLLTGLHAAHEMKDEEGKALEIVHRDVSPQNILLGVDGVTKITDFGIAWAASRLATTRTGEVKGKVVYMAPEQVHGARVDRRADVYAAGLVMWELFTGHRHFDTEHEAVLLFAADRGAKGLLRDAQADVPEVLSKVCARALSFAPGERYPSAEAFAKALEDAAKLPEVRVAGRMEMAELVASVTARVEEERKAAAERRAARASKLSMRPGAPESGAFPREAESGSFAREADGEAREQTPSREEDSSPRASSNEGRASEPVRPSMGTAAPAMISMQPAPQGRMWAPWVVLGILLVGLLGYAALRSAPTSSAHEAPSSAPASAPNASASASSSAVPQLPQSPAPAAAPPSAASQGSASEAPSATASGASSAKPALTGRMPRFQPNMP